LECGEPVTVFLNEHRHWEIDPNFALAHGALALYLRGQAYLKLGRGAEAAVEFQKTLDHRGQSPLSVLYPLAHLGLARAAVMSGDAIKAHQAYQEFFALWKDADADLPVLIEAKKEYEKLK
jgi:eukaryotic-like serine/threonine-protein kinase